MKVNYNVTGNERKELVRIISETIGEKSKYLGMPSAAYQIGGFTVSKTGELIWDEKTDIDTLGKVTAAIGAAGFDCGDEIPAGDAKESEADAEASADGEAPESSNRDSEDATPDVDGLTIGMPRSFFTDAALDNLKKLVESKASLIKTMFGIDDLPIEVSDEKVEFPWFKDPDVETSAAAAIFISKLSKMAKEAKRVTATDHEVDNPKYAMRCFLLRLGFIGAEYKDARKKLLKNLSGNSSWKNGRKEAVSDEITE